MGERESEDLWQAGREKRGAMMLRMRQRLLAIRAKEPRDCGKKHVLAARGGEEMYLRFFDPFGRRSAPLSSVLLCRPAPVGRGHGK